MKPTKILFVTNDNLGRMCPKCYAVISAHVKMNLSIKSHLAGSMNTYCPPSLIGVDTSGINIGCPECGTKMVEIDPSILDAIALMNGKGYTTTTSCGGHIFSTTDSAYTGVFDIPDTEMAEFVSHPYVTFDANIPPETKLVLGAAVANIVKSDSDYEGIVIDWDIPNDNDPEHPITDCKLTEPGTVITIKVNASEESMPYPTQIELFRLFINVLAQELP